MFNKNRDVLGNTLYRNCLVGGVECFTLCAGKVIDIFW